MSKINELREKYSDIRLETFNKLVNGDKTNTKKYLPYLLKTWKNKSSNNSPRSVDGLIKLVQEFDNLLPYIEIKDIYDPIYSNCVVLQNVLNSAEQIREEKTFVREDNCETLMETDDFLFVRPTTLKGSLKYGSNTKWCTASKSNPEPFKSYTNTGLLVYLIDKSDKIGTYGKKMAFYQKYEDSSLRGHISIFNTIDSQVMDNAIHSYGWSFEVMHELITLFKIYHNKLRTKRDMIKNVNIAMNSLNSIDFEKLSQSIEYLGMSNPSINFDNIKSNIDEFNKQMTKILKNGYTEAKS